jgi:hypothetical protein
LKKLAPYEQKLAHGGFRFMEVWTQISFDEAAAFPLFEFDAIRPLTDQEGQLVVKMRQDDTVKRILTVEVEAVEGYDQPEYAAPAASQTPPDPTPPPVAAAPPSPQPPPRQTPPPVSTATPQPLPQPAQPQPDPLTPPPHLQRPLPPREPTPPQATAPANEALAQMAALLKTLTPEQLTALGVGAPAKPPRKPRTPAVSPRPVDTTAVATQPAANENGASDDDPSVVDIMGKIDSLIAPQE